ncbi:DUF3899 domain-containing protein [Brevibacillus ginsengisoli]|uniref:DUF3899 domain-containing protein n=1 Tax=Brevibacillus ginsengisoli TaxID=363854 RepID=UPI003CF9D20F
MPSVTPENLLLLINRLFLVGLMLLIMGGILIVLCSGFLSVFLQGFSKMKSLLLRQARVLESDFYARKLVLCANKNSILQKRVLFTLLGLGVFLLLLSAVLTVCYYLA